MSIEIIKQPYLYENAFKNDNGDVVEYAQLAVDVKIGDTTCRLTKSLRGFEKEYIRDLISADNAFSENDIKAD